MRVRKKAALACVAVRLAGQLRDRDHGWLFRKNVTSRLAFPSCFACYRTREITLFSLNMPHVAARLSSLSSTSKAAASPW